MIQARVAIAFAMVASVAIGCGDDDAMTDAATDARMNDATDGQPSDAGGDADADAEVVNDGPACRGLGGRRGISKIVSNFIPLLLADATVNQYFLNGTVLAPETGTMKSRFVRCLEEKLATEAGCFEAVYTCRDMDEAHAALGISTAEFDAFAARFTEAMAMEDVPEPVQMAVSSVIASDLFRTDIVVDPMANMGLYRRLGSRNGIRTAIGAFVDGVLANPEISTFFGATNRMRLETCLTRQICQATGGPCRFGEEVGDMVGMYEPGVSTAMRCRTNMAEVHGALIEMTPTGMDDAPGIDIEDFQALVDELVMTLTTAGVDDGDIEMVTAALAPMCPDIVIAADRPMCPM